MYQKELSVNTLNLLQFNKYVGEWRMEMALYRYLVFEFGEHYPIGGMSDCIFKSNELDEVAKLIHIRKKSVFLESYQVFDTFRGKMILNEKWNSKQKERLSEGLY